MENLGNFLSWGRFKKGHFLSRERAHTNSPSPEPLLFLAFRSAPFSRRSLRESNLPYWAAKWSAVKPRSEFGGPRGRSFGVKDFAWIAVCLELLLKNVQKTLELLPRTLEPTNHRRCLKLKTFESEANSLTNQTSNETNRNTWLNTILEGKPSKIRRFRQCNSSTSA